MVAAKVRFLRVRKSVPTAAILANAPLCSAICAFCAVNAGLIHRMPCGE
jgi:hypothetical protein